MKWHNADNLNLVAAQSIARWYSKLVVRPFRNCICGRGPATVHVAWLPRCQSCANDIVNKWNEIRSNLDGHDS